MTRWEMRVGVLSSWPQGTGFAAVDGSNLLSQSSSDDEESLGLAATTMEHYRPQYFLGPVYKWVQSLPPTLKLTRVSENGSCSV